MSAGKRPTREDLVVEKVESDLKAAIAAARLEMFDLQEERVYLMARVHEENARLENA